MCNIQLKQLININTIQMHTKLIKTIGVYKSTILILLIEKCLINDSIEIYYTINNLVNDTNLKTTKIRLIIKQLIQSKYIIDLGFKSIKDNKKNAGKKMFKINIKKLTELLSDSPIKIDSPMKIDTPMKIDRAIKNDTPIKIDTPIKNDMAIKHAPCDINEHFGKDKNLLKIDDFGGCLLYTSPSPRDISGSRMPSSA